MNEDNKNRMKWGLEVLLLSLGALLGIIASVGCFDYATLAKQAGEPDNLFWFVGVANLVYWGINTYRRGVEISDNYKTYSGKDPK